MVKVSTLAYNDFQINTYILIAENNECIIIDPGCYYEQEKDHLKNYIEENNLKPILLLNTHCHVDHVLGNGFVKEVFDIKLKAHKEEGLLYKHAYEQGQLFGFEVNKLPPIDEYLDEKNKIVFDNTELSIIHVPGHSPGSIAFLNKRDNFIIVGDVLFNGSIGRTDLMMGDYDTLIDSIQKNLMVLDENMKVYPGHGPYTTIGKEKQTNPFLT